MYLYIGMSIFRNFWTTEPSYVKYRMLIMLPEGISTEYFVDPSYQYYQQCSLSDFLGNNVKITRIPKPIVMKLGVYIMPSPHQAIHDSLLTVIPKQQPLELLVIVILLVCFNQSSWKWCL
jgi:hypothetical protein